jgi:hypothetical protein
MEDNFTQGEEPGVRRYDERRSQPTRTMRRSFYVTARALRGRAMRFCILA